MSGLELAGLVLGLVPIIQLGIDQYKQGLTGREMRQLARSFRTQKCIYLNTIEEILSTFASDSQVNKLLKDPNGKAWQDPKLSEELKNHLEEAYPAFTEIMTDVKEMMEGLQKIFTPVCQCCTGDQLSKVLTIRAKPPGSSKTLKPIKMFLSRSRGEAGVDRLNRRLNDLELLRNQGQRLAVIRQERRAKEAVKTQDQVLSGGLPHQLQNTDAMRTYRKVRDCARSLHSALSRGWHCECTTPHHANLRLEARRPSQGEATADPQPSPINEGSGGDEDIRFRFLFSCATDRVENKEEGTLNENIEQPLVGWREAEIAPFVFDPTEPTPPKSQFSGSPFEETTNSPSTSHTDASSKSESKALLSRKQNDQEISTTPDTPRIRATRFIFPAPNKLPLSHDQAKKKDIGNARELEVKDLCNLIKNIQESPRDNEKCLGILFDVDDAGYGLYGINTRKDVQPSLASIHIGEPRSPSHNVTSKADQVRKVRKLPRGIRYQAAFTLASTVLQLYSTPWLEKWAKQDILYLPSGQEDADRDLVQLYISKRFASSKRPEVDTSPTSDWSQDPDLWVANKTLLTLCIVLIELAYNKPIEALVEAREETGVPPIVMAQLIAKRVSKQISTKMGQQYQLAVDWCLSCNFGFTGSEPDLHSDEFQKNFLERVIMPLQNSTEFFSPPVRLKSNSEQSLSH